MRVSWFVYFAVAVLALPLAHAGEDRIASGCTISALAPAVGSSASDADCLWNAGQPLSLQCDIAVYYTKDGNDPTSASPKLAVGDPYPLVANKDSAELPIKTLSVTAATTHTCYVYRRDFPR